MSQVRDLNSSMHTKLLERSDQRRRKARAKVARQNKINNGPAPAIKARSTRPTGNLHEAARARFKTKYNYGLGSKNDPQLRDNKFTNIIEDHNRAMLNDLNEDQEKRADKTFVRNRNHEEEFYDTQDTHLSKNGDRIELLESTLDQIKEYQLQQEEANHEAKLTLQRERAQLHQDYEYLAGETKAEYEARLALANQANTRIINDIEETADMQIEDLKITHEIEIDEIKDEARNEIKHVEQKYLNFLAQQDAEHRREIDELTFKYENDKNLDARDQEKELAMVQEKHQAKIAHIQKMADLRVQEAITDRKNDRKALINAYNFELEKQGEKNQEKVESVKGSYDRQIASMKKEFDSRRSNQNTMDREAINKAYKQGQNGYLQRGTRGKITQTKQAEYQAKIAEEKAKLLAQQKKEKDALKKIQAEQNKRIQEQQAKIAAQNERIKAQEAKTKKLELEKQEALKTAQEVQKDRQLLEAQRLQLKQQEEAILNNLG